MATAKKKKTQKKSNVKKATTKRSNAKTAKKSSAKTAAVKKKVARAAPKSAKLKRVAKRIAAAVVPAVLTTVAVKKAMGKTKAKAPTPDASRLLTPLDNRIVVMPQANEQKTAGGLIIPGTVETRPQRGEVMAVGRGRRNKKGQVRPLDVTVGEVVIFAESAGSKITLGNTDVLILREDEILGVAE